MTADIFKLHIERMKEELGWNWGEKLIKAKEGDIINICGIKVEVIKTPKSDV
jgi:hypothetical protein